MIRFIAKLINSLSQLTYLHYISVFAEHQVSGKRVMIDAFDTVDICGQKPQGYVWWLLPTGTAPLRRVIMITYCFLATRLADWRNRMIIQEEASLIFNTLVVNVLNCPDFSVFLIDRCRCRWFEELLLCQRSLKQLNFTRGEVTWRYNWLKDGKSEQTNYPKNPQRVVL